MSLGSKTPCPLSTKAIFFVPVSKTAPSGMPSVSPKSTSRDTFTYISGFNRPCGSLSWARTRVVRVAWSTIESTARIVPGNVSLDTDGTSALIACPTRISGNSYSYTGAYTQTGSPGVVKSKLRSASFQAAIADMRSSLRPMCRRRIRVDSTSRCDWSTISGMSLCLARSKA